MQEVLFRYLALDLPRFHNRNRLAGNLITVQDIPAVVLELEQRGTLAGQNIHLVLPHALHHEQARGNVRLQPRLLHIALARLQGVTHRDVCMDDCGPVHLE